MLHSPIVPAIIPTDETSLTETLRALGEISEVHVDVVDGVFVPAVSWPYNPTGSEMSVAALLRPYTLEVDLMVCDPLPAAERWVEAGADMLVFHIETISPEALSLFADSHTVTIGISLGSATPVEAIIPYAPYSEYVQVMGIREIGAQGQPFDVSCIDRIQLIQAMLPTHFVSIDGSVNGDTIPLLKTVRPDRYIVGSAIVKQSVPAHAHQALHRLVSSTG